MELVIEAEVLMLFWKTATKMFILATDINCALHVNIPQYTEAANCVSLFVIYLSVCVFVCLCVCVLLVINS